MTRGLLDRNGLGFDALTCFVPHQANQRIIDAVAERLGVPCAIVRGNVERCGNTASASIPICLSELHESGELKRGDALVVTSFGAGFTMGAIYLRWGVAPLMNTSRTDSDRRPEPRAHESTLPIASTISH